MSLNVTGGAGGGGAATTGGAVTLTGGRGAGLPEPPHDKLYHVIWAALLADPDSLDARTAMNDWYRRRRAQAGA